MRQDAVENRDVIVDAARKLFVEQGPGVSMRAIAKEAGVGVATASRHFPGRVELIDAISARALADIETVIDEALTSFDESPRDAWRGAAHAIGEMKLAVLAQALFGALSASVEGGTHEVSEIIGNRVAAGLRRVYEPLVDKAKAARLCPADATPLDIHLGLGVITRPPPVTAVSERYFGGIQQELLDVMLEGLEARARREP